MRAVRSVICLNTAENSMAAEQCEATASALAVSMSTACLRDVKAPGEDVRGDQDFRGATPELLHGAVPLFMVQFA